MTVSISFSSSAQSVVFICKFPLRTATTVLSVLQNLPQIFETVMQSADVIQSFKLLPIQRFSQFKAMTSRADFHWDKTCLLSSPKV